MCRVLAAGVFFSIIGNVVVADWLSVHYDVTDHLATVQHMSGFDDGNVPEMDTYMTMDCLWNCCWGGVPPSPLFMPTFFMLPHFPSLLLFAHLIQVVVCGTA